MEYLNSRLMFGMVPGLESTRKICAALGNPEKNFRTVHVVGTNGKGSTSFYLSGILMAHGLRTGLYTSPHLVSLRERIRVNDETIGERDLDRLLLRVKAAAEMVQVEPTFFEVLTAVAFLYYAEQKIDVAVLEAGMGGRLDSTAVANGDIIVVTSVGLEHTEILGSTESAILKEKMMVAGESPSESAGKHFVLGGLSQALLEEGKKWACKLDASVTVPEIRRDIVLSNLGQHYVENASLSLTTAEIFLGSRYDDSIAVKILKNRSWAGRMQLLTDESGRVRVILDGAHNSHAVRRLVDTLKTYYPGKRFPCLFGALKDKDVGDMLRLISPCVSDWHITRTPYPRFRELSDLREELERLNLHVESSGELTYEYLNHVLDAETPLLVTGSLYMIGLTIQLLKEDFKGLEFFRELSPSTNEHR